MKGANVYPVLCGYHFSVFLSLEHFPREKFTLHKQEGAWESIKKLKCVCIIKESFKKKFRWKSKQSVWVSPSEGHNRDSAAPSPAVGTVI